MASGLDSADSVLVVVDIQQRLFAAFDEPTQRRIVRNADILIRSAQELGVPLMVTEQYPKGLGGTIDPIASAIPKTVSIHEKTSFSCAGCAPFTQELESTRRPAVVLCGMEAHVCVLQTAFDLLHRGFRVTVAADAVGSRTTDNWRWGLDAMRQRGAEILPTESVVFGWTKDASHASFKQISKWVK